MASQVSECLPDLRDLPEVKLPLFERVVAQISRWLGVVLLTATIAFVGSAILN